MANAASVWAYPLAGTTAGQRTAQAHLTTTEVHRISGLAAAAPLVVGPSSRAAGAIAQAITTAGATTTLTRTA